MKNTNKSVPEVLSNKLICKVLDLVTARYSRCTRLATKRSPTTVRVLELNLATGPMGATQPMEIMSKSKEKTSNDSKIPAKGSPHSILNC